MVSGLEEFHCNHSLLPPVRESTHSPGGSSRVRTSWKTASVSRPSLRRQGGRACGCGRGDPWRGTGPSHCPRPAPPGPRSPTASQCPRCPCDQDAGREEEGVREREREGGRGRGREREREGEKEREREREGEREGRREGEGEGKRRVCVTSHCVRHLLYQR